MILNKKNKLLVFEILAMLFLCYQFAIKQTFTTYRAYSNNLQKKEELSSIPLQLERLTQKELVLDKQLLELNVEDISIQNNLLKYLNQEAEKNKVKIIDFNSPHRFEGENGEIETYIFDLEGGFTNILKLLNALENHGAFGAINHTAFEKTKDYRTRRTFLQTKVFIERFK